MTLGTGARLAPLALVPLVLAAGCAGTATDPGTTITLVTHDSFVVDDDVLAAFERESGYTVEQVPLGDAGTLANQLVLTKDDPLGDVVFGIDNALAGRVTGAGALDPYTPADLADSTARYTVDDGALTAVDVGDVCVNADVEWFAAHGLAVPTGFDDLVDPAYSGLLVVENPATSSPGLAFLLATIAAHGDDWPRYWEELTANDIKIAESWADAYNVDFSGYEGAGPRPLVVSYSTSPAITVSDDGTTSRTVNLSDTCFRQVEYTGILAGTDNPDGARALVDFLTSDAFQAGIPDTMYMYPADDTIALPEAWTRFAALADSPHEIPTDRIDAHREEWIRQWTATVLG